MKTLLLLLTLLSLTACPKVCNFAETTAKALAPTFESKWQCTNKGCLNTWMQTALSSSALCGGQQLPTGAVASIACPILAQYLRTQLANQVPVACGCNQALIGTDAAAAFEAICEVIPF